MLTATDVHVQPCCLARFPRQAKRGVLHAASKDYRTTSSAIPDGLVTALVISPPGNALLPSTHPGQKSPYPRVRLSTFENYQDGFKGFHTGERVSRASLDQSRAAHRSPSSIVGVFEEEMNAPARHAVASVCAPTSMPASSSRSVYIHMPEYTHTQASHAVNRHARVHTSEYLSSCGIWRHRSPWPGAFRP